MNTNHDELERLLGDELRDRAGDMGGARLALGDVRGRATSIRRRRVAVSTMGAAVVVAAVVVPLTLAVGSDRSGDTLPPATSPSVTQTAEPADSHPPLAFSQGAEIHPSDGAPFTPDVDASSGMQFVRLGDQWVVGSYGDDGFHLNVVDGDGRVLRAYEGAESGVVSNAAGTAVAWLDRSGKAMVLTADADEPTALPGRLPGPVDMTLLVALTGDDCGSGDCELVFQRYVEDGRQSRTENYRMALDGQPEQILDGVLLDVSAVSPDGALASGHTSVDNYGTTSCSAVAEIATGDVLWETCDAGGLRFSPDGKYVLGNDPYLDGPNHSMWVVLDATDGTQVRRGEGVIFDEAWSTDSSWLVVAGKSGTDQGRVLRYELGKDEPTLVGPPRDGQINGVGYALERR